MVLNPLRMFGASGLKSLLLAATSVDSDLAADKLRLRLVKTATRNSGNNILPTIEFETGGGAIGVNLQNYSQPAESENGSVYVSHIPVLFSSITSVIPYRVVGVAIVNKTTPDVAIAYAEFDAAVEIVDRLEVLYVTFEMGFMKNEFYFKPLVSKPG